MNRTLETVVFENKLGGPRKLIIVAPVLAFFITATLFFSLQRYGGQINPLYQSLPFWISFSAAGAIISLLLWFLFSRSTPASTTLGPISYELDFRNGKKVTVLYDDIESVSVFQYQGAIKEKGGRGIIRYGGEDGKKHSQSINGTIAQAIADRKSFMNMPSPEEEEEAVQEQ